MMSQVIKVVVTDRSEIPNDSQYIGIFNNKYNFYHTKVHFNENNVKMVTYTLYYLMEESTNNYNSKNDPPSYDEIEMMDLPKYDDVVKLN